MADANSNTPNPSGASEPSLICIHDAMLELKAGLHVLMYYSAADHLDDEERTGLDFIWRNLDRSATTAMQALEAVIDARQANALPKKAEPRAV
jgi:hypothetical protein